MRRISIYVPQNAVMEAVTPAYRIFTTANEFLIATGNEPIFDVEFVGLEREIRLQDGAYTITVSKLVSEVTATDVVIIPAVVGDMKQAIERNRDAFSWITNMYENGSEVISLCLGAFLLGGTGLIDGKKCSTHWAYYDEFRSMFADIEIVDGGIITDEGRIYSSGGANSIWNMLLYVLEKYTNRDTAILLAKYFAIDIDRDNQNAFTIFRAQKDHRDHEILTAQDFIESNFTDKMTIDVLAQKVNISRRSFERRFKSATNNTVNEYIQRVRIESAKRNFESSLKNVNEVMFDVGYTDTKSFRDVFKKLTGLTPVEYRNKYSKG